MACDRVKGFLSQAGVAVTERNVNEDPAAYDELIARGWQTVPMTVIGDRVIRGFDPVALQAGWRRHNVPRMSRARPPGAAPC